MGQSAGHAIRAYPVSSQETVAASQESENRFSGVQIPLSVSFTAGHVKISINGVGTGAGTPLCTRYIGLGLIESLNPILVIAHRSEMPKQLPSVAALVAFHSPLIY